MINHIPDDIPIMIGTNQHEGEMFVHSAFPAPMPKPVYWMFVGALFRDSASKVLRHYRGLVEEVEREAEEVAKKQLEEEENKQEYLENKEKLDSEYEMLLAMNETRRGRGETINEINSDGLRTLVKTWSSGGFQQTDNITSSSSTVEMKLNEEGYLVAGTVPDRMTWREKLKIMAEVRAEKMIAKRKLKALKEAAKVNVDYRPVMSAIINDYLFRCPRYAINHHIIVSSTMISNTYLHIKFLLAGILLSYLRETEHNESNMKITFTFTVLVCQLIFLAIKNVGER